MLCCAPLGVATDIRRSTHRCQLSADELRLHPRLPLFQRYFDHFTQIPVQLIQGFALRVCTGEAMNVTDQQACVCISFDDGGK